MKYQEFYEILQKGLTHHKTAYSQLLNQLTDRPELKEALALTDNNAAKSILDKFKEDYIRVALKDISSQQIGTLKAILARIRDLEQNPEKYYFVYMVLSKHISNKVDMFGFKNFLSEDRHATAIMASKNFGEPYFEHSVAEFIIETLGLYSKLISYFKQCPFRGDVFTLSYFGICSVDSSERSYVSMHSLIGGQESDSACDIYNMFTILYGKPMPSSRLIVSSAIKLFKELYHVKDNKNFIASCLELMINKSTKEPILSDFMNLYVYPDAVELYALMFLYKHDIKHKNLYRYVIHIKFKNEYSKFLNSTLQVSYLDNYELLFLANEYIQAVYQSVWLKPTAEIWCQFDKGHALFMSFLDCVLDNKDDINKMATVVDKIKCYLKLELSGENKPSIMGAVLFRYFNLNENDMILQKNGNELSQRAVCNQNTQIELLKEYKRSAGWKFYFSWITHGSGYALLSKSYKSSEDFNQHAIEYMKNKKNSGHRTYELLNYYYNINNKILEKKIDVPDKTFYYKTPMRKLVEQCL